MQDAPLARSVEVYARPQRAVAAMDDETLRSFQNDIQGMGGVDDLRIAWLASRDVAMHVPMHSQSAFAKHSRCAVMPKEVSP